MMDKLFEKAWEKYPSKIGKKAAKRHYLASVKLPVDHVRLLNAMKNYIAFVKKDGRPWRNGSTWFNNWQEWVDFKAPEDHRKKNPGGLRRFSLEHEEKMKRLCEENKNVPT